MLEREKELYSKICAASGIKDEASGKITRLTKNDEFSSSLATLLTRDKEMVAVMLKVSTNGCNIYMAKNDKWFENDFTYIDRIKNYLKKYLKLLPYHWKWQPLSSEVMTCFTVKLESRFDKLKDDIKHGRHKQHIKSLEQYKDLENPATPAFIGAYYDRVVHNFLGRCYQKFITDHKEYENFREACLNSNNKKDSLRRVYGKSIQLESADLKQTVKLHAEMNIMTNELINKEDKSRAFIAVSKK
ncbi:hypothetical protein RirG_228600 [Rhizophagus irregularis DAOM 197198w]|uniref:Uncharacterized protein n=1 Tax=Rhizophagus irregularis (strain DAOM 197198w) TaxID=1432141 RepID=A0A015LJW8_RHIIW|nr:hypothetical protein RirG_228600 [Rhizophagus irregularis DAOM 197198w]